MAVLLPTSVERVGILGGSFDPIHYGHLAIAEAAREAFALDAVLFVPAGAPPHKPNGVADAEQRYAMTLLATADHPCFYVSRVEIDRPGRSYTVETLRLLRGAYPGRQFWLLMGADMALDFPGWREPKTMLELATVVAITRPGYQESDLRALRATEGFAGVELLAAPGLAISSTELRAHIALGKSLRYLTPDPVAAYIAKMGLYQR